MRGDLPAAPALDSSRSSRIRHAAERDKADVEAWRESGVLRRRLWNSYSVALLDAAMGSEELLASFLDEFLDS